MRVEVKGPEVVPTSLVVLNNPTILPGTHFFPATMGYNGHLKAVRFPLSLFLGGGTGGTSDDVDQTLSAHILQNSTHKTLPPQSVSEPTRLNPGGR